MNALITWFRKSYSIVSVSRESKRLKKSNRWLISGNALIQYLRDMQFSRFPVLPGSAETQVIWCGIVKCLLIAYFIGNIFAKKISKSIHMCESYSKPTKLDVFWDGVVVTAPCRWRCKAETFDNLSLLKVRVYNRSASCTKQIKNNRCFWKHKGAGTHVLY